MIPANGSTEAAGPTSAYEDGTAAESARTLRASPTTGLSISRPPLGPARVTLRSAVTMISRVCATSASAGINAPATAWICAGWMHSFPRNPIRLARAASRAAPSGPSSTDVTPSTGAGLAAARDASTKAERAVSRASLSYAALISASKSIDPNARRLTAGQRAIARARSTPAAVSIRARRPIPGRSPRPRAASTSGSSASGTTMPRSPARSARAARSSSQCRVGQALIRTHALPPSASHCVT